MRKFMAIIASMLCVVAMAFGLAACGGGSKLAVDKSELDLFVGDTYQLVVTYDGAKPSGTVGYLSDNKSVATVTDKGLVTGVSVGTAKITVEYTEGTSVNRATCNVTVTEDTSKILQLEYIGKNSDDDPNKVTENVTLAFYNTGKAKLNGFIVSMYNVSLEFDWKAENGKLVVTSIEEYTIDVTDETSLATLSILAQLMQDAFGGDFERALRYLSHLELEDITITISGDQLKVAGMTVKMGDEPVNPPTEQVFLTAKLSAADAQKLGITLADRVEVESVSFDNAAWLNDTKDAITLTVGEQRINKADLAPENATVKTITYSSSATDVVSVDPKTGKITALKAGTAVITATADDNAEKKDSYTVTVNAAPAGTKVAVGWTSEDGASYNTAYFMSENKVKFVGFTALSSFEFETTYTVSGGKLTAIANVDSTNFMLFGSMPVACKIEFTVNADLGMFTCKAINLSDNNEYECGFFAIGEEDLKKL